MRAELKLIVPNDHADWAAFVSSEQPEREVWDSYGWFTLDIGAEGQEGAEMFQVVVATRPAVGRARVGRARVDHGSFHGFIVDEFKPDIVEKTLHNFVSNIQGDSWANIAEQLRRSMLWEYEGMVEI